MKKGYLYPVSAFIDQALPNEYIESFMDSFEDGIVFLNRKRPSTKGIFDLLEYFRKLDYIFLNWIEDLPDKRKGLLQSIFFVFILIVLKLRKTKVIWVLHNKKSHYESNRILKGMLFRFVARKSDYIITHSKEGLIYLEEFQSGSLSKSKYFAHPLEKKTLPEPTNQSIDLLIWGSLIPYKGVDEFLRFLHSKKLESKYNIRMVGKVKPEEYEDVLQSYCNKSIHLENRFVPENELKQYMANSKAILFTYVGSSVLSSGALMDSLSHGLNVIAPHVGAFKDVSEEGLIHTYANFEDLIENLDIYISSTVDSSGRIDNFIKENDWSQFAYKVKNWIDK